MRKSIASYVIIKANFEDSVKYLMQLNKHWNSFNFISGHYEPDEDHGNYERTIIREVEEELSGLGYNIDFRVRSLSDIPLKTEYYSERFRQMTSYEFHLFQLFFLKPLRKYAFLWEESSDNQWFSLKEIIQGASKDGHIITKFPTADINRFLSGGLDGLRLSIDVY